MFVWNDSLELLAVGFHGVPISSVVMFFQSALQCTQLQCHSSMPVLRAHRQHVGSDALYLRRSRCLSTCYADLATSRQFTWESTRTHARQPGSALWSTSQSRALSLPLITLPHARSLRIIGSQHRRVQSSVLPPVHMCPLCTWPFVLTTWRRHMQCHFTLSCSSSKHKITFLLIMPNNAKFSFPCACGSIPISLSA